MLFLYVKENMFSVKYDMLQVVAKVQCLRQYFVEWEKY